ncbi:MAG: serine/threonine-protein phosphatase, partial [Thermoproteales archaeon]|nr:serine/threonine-protein phosphatase [Thermoproteales archaeon]
KGAAAALYGSLVAGLLHTLAPSGPGPGALMKNLNAALGERKVHATYVTLLVLFWTAAARRLRMANAGVFPPLICRRGKILKVRAEGIPLGLLDDREYDEVSFQAEPGDVILLYSDGVHDQLSADQREYGRRPLYGILEQHWHKPPEAIAAAVFDDLDAFMTGADITDDQTVLVLKVE